MTRNSRAILLVAALAMLVACQAVPAGPLLVRGVVRDSDRQPVPDVRVVLHAFEREPPIDGALLDSVFTAETRSGVDGSFEFRVSPPVELRLLAGRTGGVVSFTVSSVLPGGDVARWGFPRRLRADEWTGDVPRIVVEPLGVIFD